MKSPLPRRVGKLAALTALALFTLSPDARAQDPKPAQTPPAPAVGVGRGGPRSVSDEPPDSDGPFRGDEVDTRVAITFRPAPGFTEEALDNETHGVVRLRAVFTSKGEVTNISVVRGLPDGLTRNAIDAARQ